MADRYHHHYRLINQIVQNAPNLSKPQLW